MWALMWMALRNQRGYQSAWAARYRGTLRLLAYVIVISLGFGAFSVHSARAEVAKTSLQLGRSLAPLAHLIHEHSNVDIDGESISMGMGSSDDSVDHVLDKFENHCHANGVKGQWNKAAVESAKAFPQVADLGVIRSNSKEDGMVLCFLKAEDTPETLVGKLEKFKRTHDLGSLGRLRYAYASAKKGKTTIVTLWTEGRFQLDRVMPTATFEPGSDNPLLPRPYQSRRLMSGAIEGQPYGVRGYVSTAKPREVLDRMDADMTAGGWKGVPHPAEASGRAYAKDGVIVFMTALDHDGKTMISLSEMGAQDPVQVGVEAVKSISVNEK